MNTLVYLSEAFYDLHSDIERRLRKKRAVRYDGLHFEINKWWTYTDLLTRWKKLSDRGISISEYLYDHGYRKIAIYGAGDIGKLCCDELAKSEGIEVVCLIDRQAVGSYCGKPMIASSEIPRDGLDAIVITPVWDYLGIAEKIYTRTTAKLTSLRNIVLALGEEHNDERQPV